MRKILVSILVPICNVEKFLDKCLNSLINQTLKEIEIICINDGSKDRSLEIIKKYAELDKRIVIIDKPNSGYGDSMNKGLAIAKGEYIGIIESDDFADKNMFSDLVALAEKYNADIVKSNFNFYWENPEKCIYCNNLCTENISDDITKNKNRIFAGMPAIWSAIYKKSWLNKNNIDFLSTPGASYQDTSFNFLAIAFADKVIVTPSAYLNYRQDNANSSVKNASWEKVIALHKEWDRVKKYIENTDLKQYISWYNTLKFNGYIWNYCRISSVDRAKYFKILRSEFKNLSCENMKIGYISKFCKYGGLFAIKYNMKFLLDFLVYLKKYKELIFKS